jgi:hypothetical protein
MKIARSSVYRSLNERREMSLLRLRSRGRPLAGRVDGTEGQGQEGEPPKKRSARTIEPVRGETGAYLLSRLRRECPDLAENPAAAGFPARAAALEPGFVKSAKFFGFESA